MCGFLDPNICICASDLSHFSTFVPHPSIRPRHIKRLLDQEKSKMKRAKVTSDMQRKLTARNTVLVDRILKRFRMLLLMDPCERFC
ncbi:hypothetical protein AB6A40_000350 [Gnathostoma spinigerum]|uniref:Uncharacterized protein n=1 Tax=Gnathostoma spinigerum TaxID=75299 RepID=A0ABD6E365_9BILA